MTMDIHLQITLPDDCVTPNVPRIRASFFNRKYRDIQTTPTTPKVSHARVKVTTSTRGRSRKSTSGSGGSSRQQTTPSNGRQTRGRSSIDDPFDPDFSTPRATRYLLTPPSTSRTKLGKGGRVTHLIYRPLELDNESSSESIETRRKRTRTDESPLAIEAARPVDDDSLTEFVNISETQEIKETEEDEKPRIEPQACSTAQVADNKSDSATKKNDSDDEEPEIIEVEPDFPEMPVFVPGNCNIDEILKLFGKQESGSMNKDKLNNDLVETGRSELGDITKHNIKSK